MLKNPLSSLSYTNKDFNSIYVELLDIVKQLTHKWDPSISNESDPGVILLKLDAIIGDKNNYNIDKNILEAFPESVTQEVHARNAYKQLAYKMPWYQSATTTITMRWIGEELQQGVRVKIPRYTMLTNSDTSAIYTLIDEPVFTATENVVTARIMEGTIVTHTINSNPIIDISNLDMSNRVFLNDYTVAENGIFISNSGSLSVNAWTLVDNLQVRAQGNKFYEFGVDSRNNCCYVEFPSDIDHLIETGLTIRYLISSGSQGNIAARTLDRFYEETSVDVAGESVVLSSEIVEIYNASAAVNGADPQELDDAFKTYRKTAGTFNTLVTLRDYINAIYTSGLISNGYVCDRNNDIQSTYTVITDDLVSPSYTYISQTNNPLINPDFDGGIQMTPQLEDAMKSYWDRIIEANATPDLTAFDLRLYVMKNTGTIADIQQFNSSFDMIASESSKALEIQGYIQEQQCIAHDFKNILPDKPCMFQNAYPLNIKIVPQYKLTENQITEVKLNILKSFYHILNARVVDFGQEADYAIINDAIYQSDERIKTAILDDIEYVTFAIYWDDYKKEFKRIPINPLSDITSSQVVEFKTLSQLQAWKALGESNTSTMSREQRDAAYFVYTGTDTILYDSEDIVITDMSSYSAETPVGRSLSAYDIVRYDNVNEEFYFYSNKYTEFQKAVLIKSILAGRTPLLKSTTKFSYGINHKYINEAELSKVTTGLTVAPFSTGESITKEPIEVVPNRGVTELPIPVLDSVSENSVGSYTLQPNETIRFLAPSFITNKSFSNYVKFELVLKNGRLVLVEIESEDEALDYERNYYMTFEDRAQSVYDTLYRLAQVHTVLEYYSLDKDNKNGQLKPVTEGTEYFNSTLYRLEESGTFRYLTDEDLATYTKIDTSDNKRKFTSAVKEDTKYLIYSYIDDTAIGSYIKGLGEVSTDPDKQSAYNQLILIKEEYDSRKKRLEEFTENHIEFLAGSAYLGYESQPTGTMCKLKIVTSDTQFVDVDLINKGAPFNINGTEHTIQTLLDTYCLGDMQWKSTDDFPNHCWRRGLALSNNVDATRAVSELDKYDCAVYSKFTKDTIDIKYSNTVYQIAPDTDYKLRAGEEITFFWRKEDGDDTPYTYEHYVGIDDSEETATKKSPIIKANFQLEGQYQSKLANLNETGEIKAGTASFNYVLEMYGEQDLSGTKTIDIRQMNQVTLDRINGIHKKRNKYYFITKDIVDGNYQMRLKLTSHTQDELNEANDTDLLSYRYTLDNEEFFIHTTLDTEEYEILGAGTLVGIDIPKQYYAAAFGEDMSHITLNIKAIDSNKLFSGGLDVFGDSCAEVPITAELFCREQQIYTLAEGNTLHITMTDESTFKAANKELFNSVNLSVSDDVLARPFFCTWADTVVSGFEVSIQSEAGVQSLPKLNIADDADCRWVGRAYLNISSASEEPQEIVGQYSDYVSKTKKSAQFLQYKTSEGWQTFPKDITRRPSDDSGTPDALTTTDSVILATSIVIDKVGGRDVDISYIDATGESHDTSLYIYSINEEFNDGVKYKTRSDGCIELNCKEINALSTNQPSHRIQLSKGTHILKVENTSDIATFSLVIDSNIERRLGSDDDTSYGYGTHYFKITTNGEPFNFKIQISKPSGSTIPQTDVLILYPTARGDLNPLLFGDEETPKYRYLFTDDSQVWNNITALDLSSKFNYANIVNDEVLIEDPLQSKSFFDMNHIYNDFTLAKAEILLSKATGSSIQMVNNR